MITSLRVIGIFIVVAQLAACSTTIHEPFEIDGTPPKSLSVDARQRVILVTAKGGPGRDQHVVCAEPSPDVFIAAAASASASADVVKKSAEGAFQNAESAASLSRGHTIQLLRDGLYRACEAYMNGAIEKSDYHSLLIFYDVTMITTLAIEGVTQLRPPESVEINTPAGDKSSNNPGPRAPNAAAGASGRGTASAQDPGSGDDNSNGANATPPPTGSQPGSAGASQHGASGSATPAPSSAAAVQATEMLKAYYDAKLKLFAAARSGTSQKPGQ